MGPFGTLANTGPAVLALEKGQLFGFPALPSYLSQELMHKTAQQNFACAGETILLS